MEYYTTIGIDVSDRTSKICLMAKSGAKRHILEEATVPTTRAGFTEYLKDKEPGSVLVTFETGTHSRWMNSLIGDGLGFKVHVANPAKLPTVTKSAAKNDRNDARELARLALADPELLHPVRLRREVCQAMLRVEYVRQDLIACRTKLTNTLRGFAKAMGGRIESCSPEKIVSLNRADWPEELRKLISLVEETLESINADVKKSDDEIKRRTCLSPFKEHMPRAQEVYGVGLHTAATFLAVIDCDVSRFKKARDVGPVVGFTPRQDQSGEMEKQLHATKAGNPLLRKLLVEAANVTMRTLSPDTDLKLKGERICAHGGKIAKGKARVAVARGIAVTMLALLKHPEREYVPLTENGAEELARLREQVARQGLARANHARKAEAAGRPEPRPDRQGAKRKDFSNH